MTTLAFVTVAILTVVTLLWVLRSGRLREKYAALWIIIGLAVILIGLWPGLLGLVAGMLGVQVPSNLLFFMAIILLLGVGLHLSLAVSKLEDESRILAEEVALLREQANRAAPTEDRDA